MTAQHSPYANEVFHRGSSQAFRDQDGIRRNLNHETSFTWDQVTTDGRGNVEDHPLLERKECFGRVETHCRFALYDRRHHYDRQGNLRQCYSRCDECPIHIPCSKLVEERLDSCAEASAALETFDQFSSGRSRPFLSSTGVRLWAKFLHVIKAHGGWTSVNDARVAASAHIAMQERNEKRRQSARAARQRKTKRRNPKKAPKPLSPDFMRSVDEEHDRRLKILLDLRLQKKVPPWIGRLDEAGCVRTAEVWRASVMLERGQRRVTGRAIAEWMIGCGASTVKLGSLTTWVLKDRGRIQKLESDNAGYAIWSAFQPGC